MGAVEAMNAADAASVKATAAAAEHAWRLFGADGHEWVVGIVAAVVVAPLYDLAASAAGKATIRLPFLILRLARLQMSKDAWRVEYREWKAELWEVLHEKDRSWLERFGKGLWWSITVVLRARQTARADKRIATKRRRASSPQADLLLLASALMSFVGALSYTLQMLFHPPGWSVWVLMTGMGLFAAVVVGGLIAAPRVTVRLVRFRDTKSSAEEGAKAVTRAAESEPPTASSSSPVR